jgi:predicted MFS family arabinose efflux permease
MFFTSAEDRFGRFFIAWPSIILLGLNIMLLYFLGKLPFLLPVISLLAGIGYYGSLLVLITWLIDLSGKNMATTLSIQESTVDLFIAAGSMVFSAASQLAGFPASFFVTGFTVSLAAVIISAVLLRQKKAGSL